MEHKRAPEEDIDELNDETFGGGAVEDDWEASHFAVVGGEGSSLPSEALHHDDAILKAMPTTNSNHTHTPPIEEELDSSLASLNLKDLWPSSPKQASKLESIWSSPEIPRPSDHARQATPTRGGVPPGQKVISVEELERELTSSPPPPPTIPTPQTTPLLPQHSRSPPPPHMMFLSHPPPHARMPIHPLMSHGWPLRGPPPPPPHLLPPHMLHPSHRHPQQPPGIPPYPHPHPHYPPHYPLLPHPRPHPPHPRYPLPHHQRPPHNPIPQREVIPSRRSELLSEMKADGSGFMTQKEKEWVVKVQLLQLQDKDPSNDDYYYQNYIQQKARRETSTSAPSSLSLPHVSREEKKYRPVEFQQTLGKVSQSSLTAPRKVIDAPLGGGEGGAGGEGSTARKRQVLLIIEKLYGHVLSLEELDKRALVLPEEERETVLSMKEEICEEIFTLLRLKTMDEERGRGEEQIFQQMTSYRKGKRLLKRILPILTDAALLALLRNILWIIKRDITDQVLPELTPVLKGVIMTCDLQLTIRCISVLLSLQSGPNSVSVVKVASCEFGSSLLLSLVRRGQQLCDSPYKTSQLHHNWLTASHLLHSILISHSEQLLTLSTNTTLLATLSSLQ